MHVLFDFDGTLADTFETARLVGNSLADEFGYRPVDRDTALEMRSWSYAQISQRLELPFHRAPLVAARLRAEMKRHMPAIQPFPGIVDALGALRAEGHRLGILTTNNVENVRAFLDTQGLDHIEFVVGASKLWGKADALRTLLRERALAPHDVAYVCDEVRDIEACRSVGIRSVAVGWGFTDADTLARHAPDALCRQPADLVAALTTTLGAPEHA